jgi:hypothetical protein
LTPGTVDYYSGALAAVTAVRMCYLLAMRVRFVCDHGADQKAPNLRSEAGTLGRAELAVKLVARKP